MDIYKLPGRLKISGQSIFHANSLHGKYKSKRMRRYFNDFRLRIEIKERIVPWAFKRIKTKIVAAFFLFRFMNDLISKSYY